ncbi:MAG: CHAT domain-containing protein [Flavobacteriales bacterium]
MNLAIKSFLLLVSASLVALSSFGQKQGTVLLDSLILAEDYVTAQSVLDIYKSELLGSNQIDSLVYYVYYHGKIESKLSSYNKAVQSTENFATQLKNSAPTGKTKKQILIELSSFYELMEDIETGLERNQEALELALTLQNETGSELGLIESNIGTYYQRKGDVGNALIHHRKAQAYYYSDENSSHESRYMTNNSLGGMMWYSSKLDSARYYYDLAFNEIIQADSSARNTLYRPAILKNNLAGIYAMNGQSEESMQAMESATSLLKQYLNGEMPDNKRLNAQQFYYQLIDNLGGAHKDLGDYQKAKKLISYAYEQKKKTFSDDSPEIFKGEILMGQIELALRNYPEAEEHLLEGIKRLNASRSLNLFWRADAHHYLGSLYEQTNQDDKAANYYNLAEGYFDDALQGSYDEVYLNFIIYAAPFYARKGKSERALELAHKALNYLENNTGSESMLTYVQRLNVGEVNMILGNYDEAIDYASEALAALNNPDNELLSVLDSINHSFNKPLAISLIEKAKLKKNPNPSVSDLKSTYKELNAVLEILERRKSILLDDETVGVLIADHEGTFEFLKDVSAKLYEKTGEKEYLNRIINLNESALYNRLRSQLDAQTGMSYAGLPAETRAKEAELKEALSNWNKQDEGLVGFFKAENDWKVFLAKLKTEQPEYYNLKFASIELSLDQIQSTIQPNTTVVRYIFINENLYALVIDQNKKQLFKLDFSGVTDKINLLGTENLDLKSTSKALHELYNALWRPLESEIAYQSVVVIPERELFNLSFESLITEEIQSYEELVSKSLLAKYFISYNYSLFLLTDNDKELNNLGDLAAFAPGFNDEMKSNYQSSLTDSLSFDFDYLSLLPQPFALSLAEESVDKFGGSAFLQQNSTASNFFSNAGGNNIIYIGTHAESNNINPQLSKFIFAKESGSEENEIYNYQIYNTNLKSNLAILTACETGKPTYQPGEGMISMAHAFNYAGSKSILTSLWKIDEKSNVKIVELFYAELEKGVSKDVALQRAKLAYLNTEEGRTLNPRYWSGLVLMGDTSAMPLHFTGSIWWILALSLVLVIIIAFLMRKKGARVNA